MLLEDLKQINKIYYKIEDTIADILENEVIEYNAGYGVFPYFDLAIHDNNYQNIFKSIVIYRKDCLFLYNPFTKEYRLENLNFITGYTKNSDNIIHITGKHEFNEFWYNFITGNLNITNKEVYIDDSIIDDIIMSLFSEIEYFEEYLENYDQTNLQIDTKNIYTYVDVFNCNKIKNVKLSPRITLNVCTNFIMKNSLITSIGYIIKAYLEEIKLNHFKIHFNKKHKTFIKEDKNHHIYFDIIFETDKLIDLISMYVLAEHKRFPCLKK